MATCISCEKKCHKPKGGTVLEVPGLPDLERPLGWCYKCRREVGNMLNKWLKKIKSQPNQN